MNIMVDVLNSFIFNNPTKIFFGVGKLKQLHTEPMPGEKALILTSTGNSYIKNGSLETLKSELNLVNIEFVHVANVEENPLKENCEEAARVARENNCDFIIALGGGAVLDSSVPVAVLATNNGNVWDYVDAGTGKNMVAPNKPLPIVTIATTSGTGSEINECAVINNLETNEKLGFGDKRCKPVLAVVDPIYMASVPPRYTAYQGFDALFHHVEAMISNRLNILSEAIALLCIEKIWRYLPMAVNDGNNIEARENIAFAATMSGMVMQLTRITAEHSIEHAISAYHRNVQHGAGLIMISKAFHQFFVKKHVADERYIKMARVMGYPDTNNPQDFINAMEKLKVDCGVNDLKMSDYGIVENEFETIAMASRSMQAPMYDSCPCELLDEDVVEILKKSILVAS